MQLERQEKYIKNLVEMIKVETISAVDDTDISKFLKFHDKLKQLFPNVFNNCEVEVFEGSLLIKWQGKDKDLKPILFMNHHDVVEAPGNWKYPPFEGIVAEDKIWGRGTLDTKGGLFGMLQAADELIAEGFVPEQDIYFESGCNEETTGAGAQAIVKVLKERNIKFSFILDEGGMIMYDPIGGADGTFAMVGLGEKAYADVKFTAKSHGGHASTPAKNSPLVRLGRFMDEVDKGKIFAVEISPVIREMFLRMAPFMKGALKTVAGHPDLFAPLIKKLMPDMSPTAGALLQTTVAFTMAKGSEGTNVMPQKATLVANMRFSHHEGTDIGLKKISEIAMKHDIEMEVIDRGVESRLTLPDTDGLRRIEKAVNETFENVSTVPYVMTGASDCRFFTDLSDECFRFVPFIINDEQLDSIHGLNECVDISCLIPAVDFYKSLMRG